MLTELPTSSILDLEGHVNKIGSMGVQSIQKGSQKMREGAKALKLKSSPRNVKKPRGLVGSPSLLSEGSSNETQEQRDLIMSPSISSGGASSKDKNKELIFSPSVSSQGANDNVPPTPSSKEFLARRKNAQSQRRLAVTNTKIDDDFIASYIGNKFHGRVLEVRRAKDATKLEDAVKHRNKLIDNIEMVKKS
eukprot:TRINITY_DN14122_c0_g1_i1.p1 TRINITY_DN14122_c0_g1~~TRINITY_DN14122_c0_g1_i1.p1  ORF type:complete len:192 (-),score=37.44 TRINITY_DN14122_c0_g1_i1:69-644(-)